MENLIIKKDMGKTGPLYTVFVDGQWYCSRSSFDNILDEITNFADKNGMLSFNDDEEMLEDLYKLEKYLDVIERMQNDLMAENKKLQDEVVKYKKFAEDGILGSRLDVVLEKAFSVNPNKYKEERDAAVKDINQILRADSIVLCNFCKNKDVCNHAGTEGCNGEWRGNS